MPNPKSYLWSDRLIVYNVSSTDRRGLDLPLLAIA
jgi:hypothetical protein